MEAKYDALMTGSQPRRRYLAVAEEVLRAIAIGNLRPGDRLPDERALAQQCSVSRATVREALLALELGAVIDVRPGAGCFVRTPNSRPTLGMSLPVDSVPRQVLEVRRLLEPAAARLCAMSLSGDECDHLKDVLDEAEAQLAASAPGNVDRFSECNQLFHRDVARLGGNAVLAELTRELMDPAKHPLWTLVDTIASRDEDIRAAQQVEHRAILDAIIDGDPDRAERAMAAHMEALSQRIFGAAANPIRRAGLRTPSRRTRSRRP